MCQALQELDIKSRAAESIVDDWQGPIVDEIESETESAQPSTRLVRLLWPLDQLISLLFEGVECAHRVREACDKINKAMAVDDGESGKLIAIAQTGVESTKRLIKAIRITLMIIDMFKSQGLAIARADELEDCPSVLSEIIDDMEKFSEDVSWEQMGREALSSDELLEIRAHLLSTGQASA
ncbi:MAG TPA: hypothetical protein VG125_02245 [Pirellulales bacterium]|jgi:hypothetical protein|nr:hypothetical protein [Pirellulales bacterium]